MHPHYPEDRLYHRDALWLKTLEGDEALVGINHHAQKSLGQVVYLDLPRVGAALSLGAPLGTVESHKAVSDMIAPTSGAVLAVNPRLRDEPGLVNRDPYGDGWVLRMRLDGPEGVAGLLSAGEYLAHLGVAE